MAAAYYTKISLFYVVFYYNDYNDYFFISILKQKRYRGRSNFKKIEKNYKKEFKKFYILKILEGSLQAPVSSVSWQACPTRSARPRSTPAPSGRTQTST